MARYGLGTHYIAHRRFLVLPEHSHWTSDVISELHVQVAELRDGGNVLYIATDGSIDLFVEKALTFAREHELGDVEVCASQDEIARFRHGAHSGWQWWRAMHLTAEQVAENHGVNTETVLRILRDPQLKSAHFPTAERAGGSRGTWYIPVSESKAWKPRTVGRPRKQG